MLKSTGTGSEGGAATANAKSRCPQAMRMRDGPCHAGVARATDYYCNIEGTYLAGTRFSVWVSCVMQICRAMRRPLRDWGKHDVLCTLHTTEPNYMHA